MKNAPYEVKAFYRVPRHEVDNWLQLFRMGNIDGDLLPPNYRAVEADVVPDPAVAPEATIWVLFQLIP